MLISAIWRFSRNVGPNFDDIKSKICEIFSQNLGSNSKNNLSLQRKNLKRISYLIWNSSDISILTRQVYNGTQVVKFIAAILFVYQYFLGKNIFEAKNIWVKFFGH